MKNLGELLKKSLIYMFPITAFILSLYARETSMAAKNALYLCLDVVIPSLFPFFVLSKITVPYLSGFSCPKILKRFTERFFRLPFYTLIIIVLGYLSGYPTGAKLARDMFDDGLIDSRQASRVIAVANNCSPLFLIGTIGAGLFSSLKIGFMILVIHWISGIIAAFITGRFSSPYTSESKTAVSGRSSKTKKEPVRFSGLFPSAVEEASILCIKVTGYIVLFAVLSELMDRLGFFTFISGFLGLFLQSSSDSNFPKIVAALARGLVEITSGSQAIIGVRDSSINIKLALISFICGFAGISVHTQVTGIMKGTNVKYREFFTGKLVHGLVAGLITLLVTKLMPLTLQTSTAAAAPLFEFSGMRLLTIGVLVISLGIAPYKSPTKSRR